MRGALLVLIFAAAAARAQVNKDIPKAEEPGPDAAGEAQGLRQWTVASRAVSPKGGRRVTFVAAAGLALAGAALALRRRR